MTPIRATPDVTGSDADAILKEIREGTPNTPQRIETIRLADEITRRRVAAEHRYWALENVRRAKDNRDPPKNCGHAGHMEYTTCVVCAWHLGYAEGTVAAGAYLTGEEAFADIRATLSAQDQDKSKEKR
jgi:hypothetical protein